MDNLNHIYERINKNKFVYLLNDLEEIAIKLVPSNYDGYRVFAKPKGKKTIEEYEIKRTSNLATDARLYGKQMTKKEYEEY